jgi:S1-C subfamily serine protease
MRPSEHGTSGSGLVNSFGELIGIASGNSSGMAFYSDEIEIRKFLGQKR